MWLYAWVFACNLAEAELPSVWSYNSLGAFFRYSSILNHMKFSSPQEPSSEHFKLIITLSDDHCQMKTFPGRRKLAPAVRLLCVCQIINYVKIAHCIIDDICIIRSSSSPPPLLQMYLNKFPLPPTPL